MKSQTAVLIDLYTDGDISKEVFREKKQKLEEQIIKYEQLNSEYREKILDAERENSIGERVSRLSEFIRMKAFDEKAKIPSIIIDYYVERIIFDKGVFTWILNSKVGNLYSDLKINTNGLKKAEYR